MTDRPKDPKPTYEALERLVREQQRELAQARADNRCLEKKMKSMANAERLAHMGSWIWTLDTGLVEWTDEVYRIFGLDRETFSPTIESVMNQFVPEDRELHNKWIEEALSNREQYSFEGRLMLENGEIASIVSTSEGHYDEHGNLTQISGIILDTTEHKKTREKLLEYHANLQAIIENMDECVLISDKEGRPMVWNSAYASMIENIYHIEVSTENNPYSLIADEETRQWRMALCARVSNKEKFRVEYKREASESEGVRHFETSYHPITEDSELIGFYEFTRDITSRKWVENQRRHAEKMEAVGQLAGGIAHDFNNQLGGILGYAEILRSEVSSQERLTRYVDNIIQAVRRSSDLTGQLLAFSRKGKYLTAVLDIHLIIFEVISLLKHSIDKKITINHEFNADPSTIDGDPTQLQNAILNIALNARDAMPKGGQLLFTTEIVDFDEQSTLRPVSMVPHVKLCIKDTGIGMDEETGRHIFEPFFTTKGPGEGTGMGLAAVYGTIENHKGIINFESKVDVGTSFEIFLPLVDRDVDVIDVLVSQPAVIDHTGHILLVDDEDTIREVIAQMLEDMGYVVSTSSNGAEAVEHYRVNGESIDLVILDIVMPVMSGPETFDALKAINPKVAVLIASGYSIDGEAQRLLSDGAKGFIQKPFRRERLAQKIGELLKH